jgi:hypothetical protein
MGKARTMIESTPQTSSFKTDEESSLAAAHLGRRSAIRGNLTTDDALTSFEPRKIELRTPHSRYSKSRRGPSRRQRPTHSRVSTVPKPTSENFSFHSHASSHPYATISNGPLQEGASCMRLTVCTFVVRASKMSICWLRGSPILVATLIASRAWRLPMIPGTARRGPFRLTIPCRQRSWSAVREMRHLRKSGHICFLQT